MEVTAAQLKSFAQGGALLVGLVLLLLGMLRLFQWVAYHVSLCLRGWARAEREESTDEDGEPTRAPADRADGMRKRR